MQFRSAALAVVVGVAAAIFGFALAWPDPQSLFFVSLAAGVWLLFGGGLLLHVRRVESAERTVGNAQSLPDLEKGPWGDVAATVRASLTGPSVAGGAPRRTRSAAEALRHGNTSVHTAISPFPWLHSGQAVLVSIGLFGTFFGLSLGLRESIPCIDPQNGEHAACVEEALAAADDGGEVDGDTLAMQMGMSRLLGGARTAFSKSVAGIGLGMSYMLLWRLAERRRSRLLHSLTRRVDGWHTFVSPDELAREGLELITAEVRALRDAQPDGAALSEAARQLGTGARSLASVADRLGEVSATLGDFKAETIAAEVSKGVSRAVEDRLAPTLDNISKELRILHDMKREQDEAVARHLRTLVDSLREDALLPISREVAATNAQTREVAEVVRSLGASVAASTQAVHQTSVQMGELTVNLAAFQKDAIGQLNEFADSLNGTLSTFTRESAASFQQMGADIHGAVGAAELAMVGQRVAFEQSAAEARNAFSAQTAALREAGEVASSEIKSAGQEASLALRVVRTEFADALSSQRDALEGILGQLEGAFRRDLQEREDFERKTADALRKLEKLIARTAATDAELRQVYTEANQTLGRALGETGRQIATQREALDALREALGDHLRAAADAHRKFLSEEDKHLTEVLGKLYGLVGVLAETTRVVNQRGAARQAADDSAQ